MKTINININLKAGNYTETGTETAQIAAWLTPSGIIPLWIATARPQDEAVTRPFVWKGDYRGIPVIIHVHRSMDKEIPETVIIDDALTGELIVGNDDGYMPPMAEEINWRVAHWFNRWAGRQMLTHLKSKITSTEGVQLAPGITFKTIPQHKRAAKEKNLHQQVLEKFHRRDLWSSVENF